MSGKNKLYIKILIVILISLLLILLKGITQSTNRTVENVYSNIAAEKTPDTNIVIINISQSDLERIGPWPIKRSYYALLIKELTKLGVKKIGLEVFLSSHLVTQSIYDRLLRNEIAKSGKVVLGSLAGKIIESKDKFYTDSLSFPTPKLLNENFSTGHLNYIHNNDIEIPVIVNTRGVLEKSFSYQLFGDSVDISSVPVNFFSSWQKFKHFSLVEFFNLVQNNDRQVKSFKDKIVLVGIGDLQIASIIQTAFDDQLPGVALHAFALDNLLNNRWIKKDFYIPSAIIFFLFLIGFVFIQSKPKSKKLFVYPVFFAVFLVITHSIFIFLNYKLALSFIVFPFFFLVITDLSFYLIEKRNLLQNTLNESEVLRKLFSSKQEQLAKLQDEFDITDKNSSGELLQKIKSLKTDIEKLKENEEDKTAAIVPVDNNVKEFYGIVYRSKAMNEIVAVIKKAAPEDTTVLLIGESGTGKEVAAHAIHSLSKRKDKNFVAVNCAALTESLLESELFGHVKGSFTGAFGDKIGRFEAADKGTIFLDEIGETSENFQVKLLRVLQNGEIEKVGSSKQQFVDVRIIAATNKALESAVKEKKFREDLYYRLNVIKIEMPPLRERKEDIEVLTSHFLKREAPDMNLSKAVSDSLMNAQWKGNVRELEAVIKRAVIFAKSEGRNMLQLSDLPKELIKVGKFEFDDLVLESLRNKMFSHSSMSETAKELGNVNRTMVAENFRGIVFKTLFENDFERKKCAMVIAGTENDEIVKKVEDKIQTFLNNIEKDLEKSGTGNFNEARSKFSSKYKNLPVKFHFYQDEVIKWFLKHKG